MGGYGSTRWNGRVRRTTVEETFILDIKNLAEVLPSPLRPDMYTWCTLPVWRADIDLLLLDIHLDTRSADHPYLLLQFTHPESQQHTMSHIQLAKTPLPYHGYKFHFVCPAIQKNPRCIRQLRRKLYLPPLSQPTFSCFFCVGPLTYLSCQQSHSRYAGMSVEFRQLLSRDQARKKAR